ncbi:hypothetical protein ACFS5N_08860 [Mucilaginibacter ximonensis]|uniref:Beta-galactosidase trimerisation domain-containing protein n=1 Tax=Mucilaginibacter ximonensis TaxID=538021 RepID=A0ABW5YBD1_9SPHI
MMKHPITLYILVLAILAPCVATAQTANNFKVTDRFFGVHFDFHANPDTRGIGKTLKAEDVDFMLDKVHPDYIQVDTKGHPGISSYPTKVGVAAPDILLDPLKLFREETAKRGIGLFSHFSGILDAQAVKDHPDWARINGGGDKDKGATSIFGNYAADYFIPQINELSSKYHINGVWVDGECWALQPDYSDAAIAAYTRATGKTDIPHRRKDDGYLDYVQFTRRAFHQYLTHYINAVHKFNPNLIVTSNWSFSSFMPGKVDAPVDYLSGDFTSDAVADVDFESRVLAPQGKPWDLMCWGFMSDKNGKGFYWKSARHLDQKAALVLSQGGGYQIYTPQHRDASLPMETVPMLTEVSKFCHDRKIYTYNSTPVPQVALLLSAFGHYNESPGVFENAQGGNNNVKGTLELLLDSKYSVQVLQEHHLKNNLAQYPLLVITEWRQLQPEFIAEIEQYVRDGGKVLAIGDNHLFGKYLQGALPVKSNAGLSISKQNYGKGAIACITDTFAMSGISLRYLNTRDENLRAAVNQVVQELFPQPKVEVNSDSKVHITLNKKDNNLMLHLVNVGDHFDTNADNTLKFNLPAITTPISVTLATGKRPKAVILQPDGKKLPFTYAAGKIKFAVPGLDVYSIVQVIN